MRPSHRRCRLGVWLLAVVMGGCGSNEFVTEQDDAQGGGDLGSGGSSGGGTGGSAGGAAATGGGGVGGAAATGGTNGLPPDGGVAPVDSAPSGQPSPDVVECPGGACGGPSFCCHCPGPGCLPAAMCYPDLSPCLQPVYCDDTADCPAQSPVCCSTPVPPLLLGASCQSACGGQGTVQLCAVDDECTPPLACKPLDGVPPYRACQ